MGLLHSPRGHCTGRLWSGFPWGGGWADCLWKRCQESSFGFSKWLAKPSQELGIPWNVEMWAWHMFSINPFHWTFQVTYRAFSFYQVSRPLESPSCYGACTSHPTSSYRQMYYVPNGAVVMQSHMSICSVSFALLGSLCLSKTCSHECANYFTITFNPWFTYINIVCGAGKL